MNRNRKIAVRLAGAAALGALLAGCGAPPLLSLADACAIDKDGSAVAVQGFVNADVAVNCDSYGGDYRCGLDLTEQPGGGAKAGVDILVGSGSDAMDEPPSSYTEADIRIRADNGAGVVVGDHVQASGKVSVAPGGVCFVKVDTLTKL